MDGERGDIRAEFPILGGCTYLVSHSLGAMPRGVAGALADYAATWGSRGVRAWSEGWWTSPVTVGDVLAPLLGAPAGSVVMQPNVSVAQSIVASCLDFTGRRNKVVYEDLNFPSVMYVYEALRQTGARVVTVPSDDGISVPLERYLAAIDEDTALVPLSHVLFKSAAIQDVAAIVERAHAVGALVVADVYQSAGTVPVDVTAWDVDFATGGSVKWLCGGPGAGYLYVAPRLQRALTPRVTGWMAHARPFAFLPGPIDYAGDITRFLHGTPAVPAILAARVGYEIVARTGIAAIREQSLRQVARLVDLAHEKGFAVRVPADPSARGGMVVLDVPDGDAVCAELGRREIVVDHRPGAGLRISPHFYTTDEELTRVMEELTRIVG